MILTYTLFHIDGILAFVKYWKLFLRKIFLSASTMVGKERIKISILVDVRKIVYLKNIAYVSNKVAKQFYWSQTLAWVFSFKLLHILRTLFLSHEHLWKAASGVPCFCLFCFEFDVIGVDLLCNICVIIFYIGTKCSVILLLPKSFWIKVLLLTLYKLFIKKLISCYKKKFFQRDFEFL